MEALVASGAGDFELLSREELFTWLQRNQYWPPGMPLTTDRGQLALTDDDFQAAESEAEQRRRESIFLAQSLDIGGTRYRATKDDYSALRGLILAGLGEDILVTPRTTIRLAELGTPRDRAQAEPHASLGGRGRSERDASPTQKGAIGFIGEVIANAWLCHQYDQRTVHWVSEYANLDGGTAGSDSVGYDFQVTTSADPYLFEVKATTTDVLEFSLGETETEVALRQARRGRRDRYRVIFITRVLEPERELLLLPNPFGIWRDRFRAVGQGLRYRFIKAG
jgi:hypothetical protein